MNVTESERIRIKNVGVRKKKRNWADCGSVGGGISSRSISSSKETGNSEGGHEVALERRFLPVKTWIWKSSYGLVEISIDASAVVVYG